MSNASDLLSAAVQHHQAGRLREADELYRRLLAAQPHHPDALHLSGVLAAQSGDYATAVQRIQLAIAQRPLESVYHANLGLAWASQGRSSDAVSCYRRAIELQPDNFDALHNLAVALKNLGNLDEAIELYRRTIQLRPNSPIGHNNLGLALKQRGELEGAAASYNRALQLDPNYAEAHNNLGVVRRALGDTATAIECYRRAIAAAPRHAEAHNNLANALQAVGRFEEALSHYDQAIQLRPQYADARCNRSLLVLLMGDFAKAWGDYECRSRRKESPPPRFPIEMWNGEPLNGKSILLHCEQGLGDTLQFVRYAQLIRDRGGEIILECPPALRAVLGTCSWIDRLVERGQPIPPFHTHAPLLSLPRIFGTTVETIPASCPYLHVAPALVEQWRNRLAAIPGLKDARLKVGLAWQGNPSNRYDAARSFRLADLAPLAGVPGVMFVSLQRGFGAEQLRQPHPLGDVVEFDDDFDRAAGAFMDTAAVMTQLDLVVTADSALAHVAGALNVPAWVALPFVPDWRWLLNRTDSPWYPSLKLFRQYSLGDWTSVFATMADELTRRAAAPG